MLTKELRQGWKRCYVPGEALLTRVAFAWYGCVLGCVGVSVRTRWEGGVTTVLPPPS